MTITEHEQEELVLDLAERLQVALYRSGMTRDELADALEVNSSTVSRWLNGHSKPRPRDLKLVAEKCGVPFKWLVHPLGLEPRTHCLSVDKSRVLVKHRTKVTPANCRNSSHERIHDLD